MTTRDHATKGPTAPPRHAFALYVRDLGDALRRITSVICRRGYRLDSLSTSPTEHEGIARVILTVEVEGAYVHLLIAHLTKIRNVLRVEDVAVSRPPARMPVDSGWIGGP